MKCKRCKANIDIFKPPFGAYFCKKNHPQCGSCELSSSICMRCGEETKYKSPHFRTEKDTSSKTVELCELQVPIVRDIEPTSEEEKEFRKIRLSFNNGKENEIKYFRGHNKLNSVRTLSALITKDLCSTKKEAQAENDFRFKKIIRALRETGCPSDHPSNGSDEDDNTKKLACTTENGNSSQLKILYPQQSQLRESSIRLTSSSAILSKIIIKPDTKPDDDLPESSVETSEKNSLNLADFKAMSCSNLVDYPPIGFPISIEAVSLDRHPFYCPISNCVGKIFLSDFNRHIISDHPNLPLSQIKFGQFREVLIDLKLCTWTPSTIACFLMRKIVTDFSVPPLKDILPMLLMMGRYRFKEKSEVNAIQDVIASDEEPWTPLDCLIIWLAGIVPEQLDISVGISVFSKVDDVLSRWYVDQLNPIQNSANVDEVFQEARRLVLTFREVQVLTNNFQDKLRCQVGLINQFLKDKH